MKDTLSPRFGLMGMTPLHWAAHGNDLETVELLISAGAGLNIQDSEGQSPLHLFKDGNWPFHFRHEPMMDLLIKVPLREHYFSKLATGLAHIQFV